MNRALELEHHAGPYTIPLVDGEPEHVTVYREVLARHKFLDWNNHRIAFPFDELGEQRQVMIARPQIYGWDRDGYRWEDHWFSQRWQLITPETYDERIADAETRSMAKSMLAQECRDTVRGRKARREYLSLVSEYQRQIRVFQKAKQNLIDGVYGFGW